MRMIAILAAISFVAVGCSSSESEETSQSMQTPAAEEPGAAAAPSMPGMPGGQSAEVDPALKEYEYPGATLDGTFSMGNTVSAAYKSPDDFDTVVDYYAERFTEGGPTSDTNAYFGKQNPDGSSLTVTLTYSDNMTQIILRLDKAM